MGSLKPYLKAVVQFLIVVCAGAVAQGLIVGRTAAIVTVVIGALGTYGVYQVRNQPTSTKRPRSTRSNRTKRTITP
jgi:hypothetical protein